MEPNIFSPIGERLQLLYFISRRFCVNFAPGALSVAPECACLFLESPEVSYGRISCFQMYPLTGIAKQSHARVRN